ncbi:MAG: hypothetical protein K0U29_07625 [Gammaproteobacteria bacterium]|nr:hypothetical protein [Gammaproteobacteria bacterium]MCH9744782.1 hypothetical protein [Gammaproteobacteria bacterium]
MGKNIFTAHPASVGETYWQHWFNAARFSLRLIFSGFACLIHSFLPFLFADIASDCVAKMCVSFQSGQRKKGFDEKLKKLKDYQDS